MVDLAYEIVLLKSCKFDLRLRLIYDCFSSILQTKASGYGGNMKFYTSKLYHIEYDPSMLFTFADLKESNIIPIFRIIEDISQNWQIYMTKEIFDNQKIIQINALKKVNEDIGMHKLWLRQYRSYPKVLNIPKNIKITKSLRMPDFLDFSNNLLSNSQILIRDIPII